MVLYQARPVMPAVFNDCFAHCRAGLDFVACILPLHLKRREVPILSAGHARAVRIR